MSTVEFDEGGNQFLPQLHKPEPMRKSFLLKLTLKSGLAKDEKGANRVLLIFSLVCIVLMFFAFFAGKSSQAPGRDAPNQFIFRPEVPAPQSP